MGQHPSFVSLKNRQEKMAFKRRWASQIWEQAQGRKTRSRTNTLEGASGTKSRFISEKELFDKLGPVYGKNYINSVSKKSPREDWVRWSELSGCFFYNYHQDWANVTTKNSLSIAEDAVVQEPLTDPPSQSVVPWSGSASSAQAPAVTQAYHTHTPKVSTGAKTGIANKSVSCRKRKL